ncbi:MULTISPECIES: NUDIX hydrolase [unclassified Cytobacillus]|uniref:NUDIX hydrolase n=1 Tax=unclassified Cytobacillus TaxID=2675268 RepID=UPI00135BAFBA|nr:NUDIX hydrolase [Cytobacillus sp. AMY 15.2]KAF0819672.1 ADP-ribose pyrophosphatase [Bacillus sp. ZZV12-4809]MCM3090730.1 NUDIX hydrolase [Cytobacillus sp. AMY 15.2]
MEWKINQTRTEQVSRFEIIEESVTLPNDTEFDFSYINFAKGVCILPITDDRKILCIRQYRHAVKQWQWELPAGMIDNEKDDPLLTAKKELEEETGYQAQKWIPFGSFYPSPGSTSEEIYLFAATGLKETEQRLEPTEFIDLYALEATELYDLINKGEFQHGAGMAAILRYLVKKESLL